MKLGIQSRRDDEEIRANDLIRVTQKEVPLALGSSRREHRVRSLPLPKGIKFGLAALVVLFIAGSVASYYIAKRKVATLVTSQTDTLQQGLIDLQNFDPVAAQQQFASLNDTASLSASGIWSVVTSLFKGTSGALHSFGDVTNQLTIFSQNVANLEGDIVLFASGNANNNFVADLTNIKNALAAIDADTNQLPLSTLNGGSFIPLKARAEAAESFLNSFIPWLADTSSTHHLLVLFENSSEMRPGGGFIGSYADVSIKGGAITDVAVHDVADVDNAFTPNIVPPKPLQLEGARFRPADGNWFFDFSTSASKTIELFDQSTLKNADNTSTTFDGVIAISPTVASDLLSIFGPVTVSNPSTTFTSDNLTIQLQKIVQAGQAQSATYPKAVLSSLSQALFAQLASSTDDQRQQLLSAAIGWIKQKDVMVYFSNPDFQKFVDSYDITGAMYNLPQNFNGDYLAIANADINSDKSELYINQTVSLDTQINSDGTINNHLIIDRTHTGDTSPYWWYQTTNTDYIQLFVPQGSSVDNESGGIVKNVPAPINYGAKGYLVDPLVFAIESSTQTIFGYPALTSHQENGKQVFATWLRVHEGTSTELSFDYSHHLYQLPADGEVYQFVFERQAGATGDYKFEFDAPLSYLFKENGLATYDYESENVPGRLIITLTLQKI